MTPWIILAVYLTGFVVFGAEMVRDEPETPGWKIMALLVYGAMWPLFALTFVWFFIDNTVESWRDSQ